MARILVLFIVGFLLIHIAAEGPCGPDWIYRSGEEVGKCYYVNTTKVSQVESARRCEEMGAYLACIASQNETDFIRQKLNESGYEENANNQYWIGLYKETAGETLQDGWAWIDNTTYVWRNWFDGEPNIGETCARLASHRDWLWGGAWCDEDDFFLFGYICEKKVHVPSTVTTQTSTTSMFNSQATVEVGSTSRPLQPCEVGDKTGDSEDSIFIGFGTALGCLCVIFVVVIIIVVWRLRKRPADSSCTDQQSQMDVIGYDNPQSTGTEPYETIAGSDTVVYESIQDCAEKKIP